MNDKISFPNLKGFTIVELVLTVALLGVLVAVALPKLNAINLTNARANSRDATVGAVQTAVWLYGADKLASGLSVSYPSTLDSVATTTVASNTNPLFNSILLNGVNSHWKKGNTSNCYYYDEDGTGGYTSNAWQYNSSSGTFLLLTTSTCT